MLILAKSVLAMMIGFIISVIFGLIAVPMLRKLKASQHLSTYLGKAHSKKEGTPTMGGIIFIIPTLISMVILLALINGELINCFICFLIICCFRIY